MKKYKDAFTFRITTLTPMKGEPVTRAELRAYILIAIRTYWAWGARMKWRVQ